MTRLRNIRSYLYAATLVFIWEVGSWRALAAEWQWSAPIATVTSPETQDHPRAFLWIPPNCKRVRAVVVGQHNMEEEPILEHPLFRTALADLGFAEVWVSPGFDLSFRFDQGAGEHFNTMMKALAEESGYTELEWAPVVPIGHSAAASFPWNFAAWNSARTLAVISVSGQWPIYRDQSMPDWGGRTIDGVPGLVTMGEYEWAESRAAEGLKQRAKLPRLPLSMLAEPGGGHFDVSDAKVAFLALYLKKAAEYRLPADIAPGRPVELKPIDPVHQGWLVQRWRRDRQPGVPAASLEDYRGEKEDAFWCFDEEHARATEAFEARMRGGKEQLVGYLQDGQVVGQDPNLHAQVNLQFHPVGDGMTFKLTGTFLDTVPKGRPERWTGLSAGSPIAHARDGGPVLLSRICGPVIQTAADTFAIRFDRMGMKNVRRSNEIWLLATHHGDVEFRRAVQQSVMHFPLWNTEGAPQQITFPSISDQPAGVRSLKLNATSDVGSEVHYYVREGPAEIDGDTLRFTPIPPRAKIPVKVTVVAWQWGRTIDPKLQTAQPVSRSFLIGDKQP